MADTFTTTVMKPPETTTTQSMEYLEVIKKIKKMNLPVTGGSHGDAGGLAFVPGHALAHVGHCAIDRYQIFQRNHLLFRVDGLVLDLLVQFGLEQGYVQVHWKGECQPPLQSVPVVGQGRKQVWSRFSQIFHMGFPAQLADCVIWLWTHFC